MGCIVRELRAAAEKPKRKAQAKKAKRSAPKRKQPTRKDPRRVAAGRKAAERRRERLEFAGQDVPEELQPIWDWVKWRMPYPKDRTTMAEVFMEWVEENPQEIVEFRARSERRREAALKRLNRHCVKRVEQAEKELAKQGWSTLHSLSPELSEQLDECAEDFGDDYEAARVEQFLREQAGGFVPF